MFVFEASGLAEPDFEILFLTLEVVDETFGKAEDDLVGNGIARVGAMGVDGLEEVRHLVLVHLFHALVVMVFTRAGECDVGQSVAEFDEGCIGRGADA